MSTTGQRGRLRAKRSGGEPRMVPDAEIRTYYAGPC
jgi:hypothetical protein